MLPGSLVFAAQSVPFTPTRSYTLEGAVTPVEERRQARSPKNTTPQSPSLPSAPSIPSMPSARTPDATTVRSPRTSPKSPKKEQTQEDDIAALGGQPPSTLMTKFSTKPPFRHIPPPKPAKAPKPEPDVEVPMLLAPADPDTAPTAPAAPPKKKPAMACLFCRERKICCGPPAPDSTDPRCKCVAPSRLTDRAILIFVAHSCRQCIKREQECVFPTECRRGQHKRTPRKAKEGSMSAAGSRATAEDQNELIIHTEQPPTPTEPVAGTSAAGAVQAKATTQKVKAATKRGRKPRVKPLEGVPKIPDKPTIPDRKSNV